MRKPILNLCFAMFLASCSPLADEDPSHSHGGGVQHTHAMPTNSIDDLKAYFEQAAIIEGPTLVDCTLSNGTQATCFSITVKTSPTDYAAGPWCPRNISDAADKGGVWIEDNKIYDVDGAFVKNLDVFYDDDYWQVYDPETGNINVTDTKEQCMAAARPDVDPQYYNYCVECQPSYMSDSASMTYTIPINPVKAENLPLIRGTSVGLSFSGVLFDGPAPVDAILDAHTLAPFDDCGGHVNLAAGYHIHAELGCGRQLQVSEGHAPMIGIAMDGFPIHTQLNEDDVSPNDLDICRGHEYGDLGYHYHAGEAGNNQILSCLSGESGCSSDDPNSMCNASIRKPRPINQNAHPPLNDGRRGGNGGPPAEAFQACANKPDQAQCTVLTPQGELNGICVSFPSRDELICEPNRI